MSERFGDEVDDLLIKLMPDLTQRDLNTIYKYSDWNHIKTENIIVYLKDLIKTKTCHADLNVGILLRLGKYKLSKMMIKAGFYYTKQQINVCFEFSDLYNEIKIDKNAYPDVCDEYDIVKMKIMENLIEVGIPKNILYMCSNFHNCFTTAMLMEYDHDMFTYMSNTDKRFYKCIDNMRDMDFCYDLKVHLKISRLSNLWSYMNVLDKVPFNELYETTDVKKELFNLKLKNFISTEIYDRAYDMYVRHEFKESTDHKLLDQALDDITTIHNAKYESYYRSTPEQFFSAIDRLYMNGFEHLDEWDYIYFYRNKTALDRKKYIENPTDFYSDQDECHC